MSLAETALSRLKAITDPPLADARGRAIRPPPEGAARESIGRSVLRHYAADASSVVRRLSYLSEVAAAANDDAMLWVLSTVREYGGDPSVAGLGCQVLAAIMTPTEQSYADVAAALIDGSPGSLASMSPLSGEGGWGRLGGARELLRRESEAESARTGRTAMAAAAVRVVRRLRAQGVAESARRAVVLRSHGGVRLLCNFLHTHGDHAGCVCGALSAVERLCHDDVCRAQLCARTGAGGGLLADVADALRRFSDEPTVQAAACGALGRLVRDSAADAEAAVAAGCMPLLIGVLRSPPRPAFDEEEDEQASLSADAVRVGCEALASLCEAGGSAVVAEFVQAGGLRVLLRAARSVLRDTPAQQSCARCLAATARAGYDEALGKVWAVRHTVAALTALVAAHEPDDIVAAGGHGVEDPEAVLCLLSALLTMAVGQRARQSLAAVGLSTLFRVFRRHVLNAEVLTAANSCVLLVLQDDGGLALVLQQGHAPCVVESLRLCDRRPALLGQLVDIVSALAKDNDLRVQLARIGGPLLAVRALQQYPGETALTARVARCLAAFASMSLVRQVIAEDALPVIAAAAAEGCDDHELRAGAVSLFLRYTAAEDSATEEDRAQLVDLGAAELGAEAARHALDAGKIDDLLTSMRLLQLLSQRSAADRDAKGALIDAGALEICASAQDAVRDQLRAEDSGQRGKWAEVRALTRDLVASLTVRDQIELAVARDEDKYLR
eukprot:TRINITY_DN1558_c0_g6_i1.p1 TRINITY_DN1558_c0_g6~~TRINITY_DN1558_c0_g6_i1.p1  ORF type:complete len:745 (+),score=275.12 TRINITY_DN1558_c0_g6_i1:56-2236(+)